MLLVCAEVVEPTFRRADGTALRHQWIHWQLVKWATSFGTAAVVFAVFAEAYQFARNTDRYRAKAVAMTSIDSALEHVTDARSRFLGLWFSEQTLENEHREWLRLMLEAEWFS
jgi:hypothetical protein